MIMILRALMLHSVAIAVATSACAYEVETHVAITTAAVSESNFGSDPTSTEVWNRLGVVDPGKFGFTTFYLDLGSQVVVRGAYPFQENKIGIVRAATTGLVIPPVYSLTGWLLQGALREDDNGLETPDSDEPGGVFSRVYAHWYDPHFNQGLTPFGFTAGPRAVDWALVAGKAPIWGRENHFKASDAREAMWRALTLTTPNPDGTLSTNVSPVSPPVLDNEKLRQAYWNTT